jgi:MFS family permease
VYFKAIAAELGQGQRFGVSLGITISNVIGAAAAPFIGRSLDHRSIKAMMITGALIVSTGFALLSGVRDRLEFYAVLAVFFGFGLSMMGGLASSKLVTNWFFARRGMALGIAAMGISLSGIAMPTLATWLIAHLGWRGGFQIYAACTLAIVVPLVARFAVNRPEEMGLRADGGLASDAPSADAAGESAAWRTAEILRSRNFWALALCFSLSFSALSAILTHLVPFADDIGIAGYRAAWLVSAAAGTGVLGKLAFGWLVDRADPRVAVWCSLGTQMLGLLLLMQQPGYAGLAAAAAVFGFGMGGVIPLQGAVVAAAFGGLSFGKAMGLLRPVAVPVQALGIPLAGWIHDATGSYALAFRILVCFYALAIAFAAGLRVARAPVPVAAPVASGRETGLA